MKNQELVRTTPLKGLVAARAGGANPIEAYGQLIELVQQRCGDDVATMFAEPHPGKSDSSEPSLTWYTSLSGPMTALPDLDEVARAPVVARLSERLEKLKPLLRDKQLGPMMASWLYVPSAEHILSIGGDPLLICWGYVPQDVALSPSRRAQHFAETLGKYAPELSTPPFTPQEAADYIRDAGVTGQPAGPASAGGAGEAVTAAAASGEIPVRRRRSRAPLIASALAAIVLAILLIPGVLLYPSRPDNADVERQEALLREDNKGLADRLHELEAAGNQRVCRLPNGQLSPLPAALAPAGRPGAPAGPTPPNATPATPPPRADLLPPPPNQVQVPNDPAAPAGAPTALNDLIDRAVVFVKGDVVDQPGHIGMGTGFFVTADRIVTNRHVIESLVPSSIIVTNKKMGQAMSARVVAKTSPPPADDLSVRDFAILAVDSPGQATVKLGPSIEKSASVVAAGYPGFLVEGDPGFQRLVHGDRSASPDNTIQYGFVIQKRDTDPVKLVTHSAPLGHGNSGGPLFDLCSRVVGVNTAVRNEGQIATSANFAQDVSELRAFLAANGVTPESNETRMTCPPAVAQAAVTPNPQQPAPQQPASPQPAPSQPAPNPSR
jgi:S1-C subfamily serine protease